MHDKRSQHRMNWDNLTESAQRAVMYAQEEAQRLGNDYLGTEHLLLGILREGQGVAYRTLTLLGVNFTYIIQRIENIVKDSRQSRYYNPTPSDFTLTTRAKRVLEIASREAQMMMHNYIGTEHILLGLLQETEGIAGKVLLEVNIDPNKGKEAIMQIISIPENLETPRKNFKDPENRSIRSKTPHLDLYSKDLTSLGKLNKLDPVIGREKEIHRLIQILLRRTKNNPVLIGDPGVGKTVIVEGLAQRVAKENVPSQLKNKRIVALELTSLIAGTKYRGEFEDRMKKAMEDIKRSSGEIILFIDELHTVVGAGAAEGSIDASNILKPALARGELHCIGATTYDEYRKHIEKDPALERRFQPIFIDEPSIDETIKILQGLKNAYENHHQVLISDEAIVSATELSSTYITQRFLPDKAIDLMDEACSFVRLVNSNLPQEITDMEQEAFRLEKAKEKAIRDQDFEGAAHLRDQERSLRLSAHKETQLWQEKMANTKFTVNADNIASVVSQWTGIPIGRLIQEEKDKLLMMEEALKEKIIGQDHAVAIISHAIRRAKTGIKDSQRPLGSFIFLGPTGVGKTEMAFALAEYLFGRRESLIRFDMSEYMEKFSVSRLIGAPPGYIGYEEGGQLTEAIRRQPFSVVLFDEIEKAHADIYNILLQIFDGARLTDSQGRIVDFSNTIIIMTSNVFGNWDHAKISGFQQNENEASLGENIKRDQLLNDLKKTFRLEFLNRLDELIVFNFLTQENIMSIVDLLIQKLHREIKNRNIHFEFSQQAKELLAKEGYQKSFGARPLWRTIQKRIVDPISESLLKDEFTDFDTILIDRNENDFLFCRKKSKNIPKEKTPSDSLEESLERAEKI